VVSVLLVAATCPRGQVAPLSRPEPQWQQRCEHWPLPGRFSFFVFQVTADYDITDFFPGLDWHFANGAYFVAGTLDKWDAASYALLKSDSPHDCCEIYRTVYTTLSSFGYPLRGQKTTNQSGFFLR
jgi:hypothetical protein